MKTAQNLNFLLPCYFSSCISQHFHLNLVGEPITMCLYTTDVFFFMQIVSTNQNICIYMFFKLLIGHEYFHTEMSHCKKVDQGLFFQTCSLQKGTSSNHSGWLEQMPSPSPTKTSITIADKLIMGVSQSQVLFDKQEANYKNNDIKDNKR